MTIGGAVETVTTEPDHDLEFEWDEAKAEANLRKHGARA